MATTLLARLVDELRAAVDDDPASSRVVLHEVVQNVVAGFPACVLIADAHGRLVAASDETLQTLGYTLASLRELNVTELAGHQEEDEVELLWESFRRERRQRGRFTLRHRNGTLVPTRYAATSNTVAGLLAAVHVVGQD